MTRKTALRKSRGAKPNDQPQRYGLRKRSAQQAISNGDILHDAGHDIFAKRIKRTSRSTRAQSLIPNRYVKKSAGEKSASRWAKKNKNKFWLAEAILEENDTQYRIKYEPVHEGAQPEISWQPKRFANAALLREWEERRMAVAHGSCKADNNPDSRSKVDGAGQRSDFVRHGHQEIAANLPSQEPYNAHLESREQHAIDLVDKRTLAGFGNSPEKTLLTATNTTIPEDSSIHTPEPNAVAAETYDDHKNRELRDSSAVALYTLENGSAPPSCGLQIHEHGPSEGDTAEGDSVKPAPRPGTSISTILSPESRTLSYDNKDDESSTFAGEHSSQASPSMSTEAKVPNNRDVSSGPPGKLASAREQLRLLLRGPGKRRYRKSHPSLPPSP